MNTLKNQVAIVTGASSGIGRATALLFAAHGAKVVLAARRERELREVAEEIELAEGSAAVLAGDVQEEDYNRRLVALAVERFGGLDIAFNNAGTLGPMGTTPEVSGAAWTEALHINLSSAFYAAKYQLPAMLARRRDAGRSASLIFTSTFVGYTVGMPGMASYAASKAGLIGLTQALAAEFGPSGIRVNALLPGGTETPMGATVASTPEALAMVKALHALKRIASPQEIAQSALYLASDAASFTTGTALLVDGGVSINRS